MVTAIFVPSNLTIPRADDIGAARVMAIRRRFLELPICKWIERQKMSFFTGVHGQNWAVFLNITQEEYILLQMKLDDPRQLRWVG